MKKYIISFLIISLLIGSCVFLVFNRHETFTITYIRFKVNPEFVIGINNKDRVVFYNALNSDAKMFNLLMFNERTLSEVCNIFIKKMDDSSYFKDDNTVKVTIITMNNEKKERIYNIISNSIDDYNEKFETIAVEPTNEELLTYSNEVAYDLDTTYKEEDLKEISALVYQDLTKYVKDKINNLKISKLNKKNQIDKIKTSDSENYFNDYDFKKLVLDNYKINFSERTSYKVNFLYNDDYTYSFDITLNLEFNYCLESNVEGVRKATIEVYKYTYSNDLITNYKNNFYKVNY